MKPCALCRQPALLFCESDRASLCWECDSKVHGANFLVARHTRCLLCRVCQEPTPWKASGSQLGKTVSVCDTCASGRCQGEKEKAVATAAVVAVRAVESGRPTMPTAAEVREDRGRSSGEEEEEYDDDDDLEREDEDDLGEGDDEDEMGTDYDDDSESDYSDDEEEELGEYAPPQNRNGEEEEDGENQVVPWSSIPEDDATAAATEPPPPPSTAGSSSSDDADYNYDSNQEGLPSARDRMLRRVMFMQADEEFDGAAGGFAKRRMLTRGNASTDLAPSYSHYQVC